MNQKYNKTNVRIKLIEFLFTTQKLGTDFFVAKTMLEKSPYFPATTIEEIAYLANTTPASVTKFCKKLDYHGFVELKNDTYKNANSYLFSNFHNTNNATIEEELNSFLDISNNLIKSLFEVFEKEQISRIAKKVSKSKRITIITGLHGFAAANLFSELMMPFGITIYEIQRNSEIVIIKNAISVSDIVFVISLTGKWATNTFTPSAFSKKELQNIIILNYSDTVPDHFLEIVSLSSIENFFSSNYISSNALQAFFILLTAYVNKIR